MFRILFTASLVRQNTEPICRILKCQLIQDGATTSCVNKDDRQDFTLKANATDTISTCDPWMLTIKGGVKPYKLTLLQLGSPTVTNVTMGAEDDGFVYVMRGAPDTLLIGETQELWL